MKGCRWVDPTKDPHPLVTLTAILGWAALFAYVVSLLLDWLSRITWFV